MKKSRTINEFKKLSNNQQISELTTRMEQLRKDYMKMFKFTCYKIYEELPKEEQKELLKNEKYQNFLKLGWDIYKDFSKIIPYFGQYEEEIKYRLKGDFYEYTCPYCGYVHKIGSQFYIFDELEKHGQVQDSCFHCEKILYMEYEE